MTRPIPVQAERKRPSKSCTTCRAAKAKCTGLSEEYLHAVDDPLQLAHWPLPLPTCDRCSRSGALCNFQPSRRKGRPRRLPKNKDDSSAATAFDDDEAHEQSSRTRTRTRRHLEQQQQQPVASGSGSGSSSGGRSPSTTHTSLPTPDAQPYPSSSSAVTAAAPCDFFLPAVADAGPSSSSSFLPLSVPSAPPPPPPPPPPHAPTHAFPSIVDLAARYIESASVWCPFLPHSMPVLHAYLSSAPATLPHALACLLDPHLPAPSFDPSSSSSSSTLALAASPRPAPLASIQTALVLSLHSFAFKDRARSIDLLQWACRELRALGWAGDATPPGAGGHERDLLVRAGWYAWGIEIHMGFICGVRASILCDVPPPAVLDPFTLQRHVLAVAQDATDYSYLWSLDIPSRDAYIASIVTRATSLHAYALTSLANPSLSAPAQRSPLFSAALISQTATVLVLSSLSPLSPLIAPLLPCSLDTTSPPPPPGTHVRARITSAARAITDVVRAHATTTGAPFPPSIDAEGHAHPAERVHSPFFGCCLVVAARGALLAAEDVLLARAHAASLSEDEAHRLGELGDDLDLCERELRRQAGHWPASETLATEVGLLRRTAGAV
ncbi:hypothetical protein JCM8208_003342 [Rhodotorula glutinis]